MSSTTPQTSPLHTPADEGFHSTKHFYVDGRNRLLLIKHAIKKRCCDDSVSGFRKCTKYYEFYARMIAMLLPHRSAHIWKRFIVQEGQEDCFAEAVWDFASNHNDGTIESKLDLIKFFQKRERQGITDLMQMDYDTWDPRYNKKIDTGTKEASYRRHPNYKNFPLQVKADIVGLEEDDAWETFHGSYLSLPLVNTASFHFLD